MGRQTPIASCARELEMLASELLSSRLTGRFARDGEPEPEGEPKEDDEETYSARD